MIRDLAERSNPNYVYHLAIYPAEPDFDLKIMVPTITLYRGQTVELPVRVRRHGGWDTPVDVGSKTLRRPLLTRSRPPNQSPPL